MDTAKKVLLLALALGAMELVLRLAFAFPPTAERLAMNDDLSYRRAWMRRQRSGDDVLARIDRYDPLLGWRPRPDLAISMWDGKKLTTNAQGFRSHRDYAAEKSSSSLRLLVLGDSFTFGEEVADDEVWTQRLELLCPRLEVFNLGVHGYGHDQMLLLLRELGRQLAPDVVLVGFLNTDMYRNVLSFRDYAKPRFVLEGGELRLSSIPVPTPEELLRSDRWRPRLVDFAVLAGSRFENLVGLRTWRKRRMTAVLIGEIARFSSGLDASPALVFLPAGSDLEGPDPERHFERFFWQVCRQTDGLTCMSVSEALLQAVAVEAECCTAPQSHWNGRGHELAAQSLLRSLLDTGLVDGC